MPFVGSGLEFFGPSKLRGGTQMAMAPHFRLLLSVELAVSLPQRSGHALLKYETGL